MPRPPILPTINWKSIFESGLSYADWIQQGERMDRADDIQQMLSEQVLSNTAATALKALSRPVYVVAIAENWCGDVVRHVPVLQKMAQESEQLKVSYIAREGNEDVFVRFVTNGGEAIPKFLFLNNNFVECGNWGPMPQALRVLIARGKASGQGGEARQRVSEAYAADPDRLETLSELMDLVEIASAEVP
jgi:hypothetical protein